MAWEKSLHPVNFKELLKDHLNQDFLNHCETHNLTNLPTTVKKALVDPSTTPCGKSKTICVKALVPGKKMLIK